jgi:serine/threonine protein kinase
VARLAEGLEHAHSRGLLHRDLKPANVLLAGDGTPMLLDFNLAADVLP